MRVVKPLLGIVVVVSLLLNAILLVRARGKRTIIQVNGVSISRSEMNNVLELQFGPQYKANQIARVLLDQEAKKFGLAPTDAEIQEAFDNKKELDWSYALRLAKAPWLADEARAELRMQQEEDRLRTKDVVVTDDEVRDEYQKHHAIYDTPNKARCSVAAVMNDAVTEKVRSMLLSQNPPYSPVKIMENFPREVVFLGDHNRFTFAQPFQTNYNNMVFDLEPKSVKVQPPGELAQLGAKQVLIRLDEIVPGHMADMSDPKIIRSIKLNIALRRARTSAELISDLWKKANLVFEDPADKVNVELILFPDQSRVKQAQ